MSEDGDEEAEVVEEAGLAFAAVVVDVVDVSAVLVALVFHFRPLPLVLWYL